MDSAADSLLALSNTAAALAEMEEDEDDRSSSLSDLDDDVQDDLEPEETEPPAHREVDSEAETERLEISPDKIRRKSFGPSPSKLAVSMHVEDNRPEIESLTDSDISSPISSEHDLLDDDALSDVPANKERVTGGTDVGSPTKRKREDDESDTEERLRSRRRRTGSVESENAKSDGDSDADEILGRHSREGTLEPETETRGHNEDEDVDEDEDEQVEKVDTSEDSKAKKRGLPARTSRRRGKEELLPDVDHEIEDEADAGEDSEEVDVDDAEAAAKSEEEQAKRMAAMEALAALEKHFAVLRDRLYDERIASINHELAQLNESIPSHPELLRQLECVRKHRDDKFEVEQKLLVYKIGALKNKSVAERSQIHSAYFQTVRDIREKHLERISEHFYRIQRDRFKAEAPIPSYTVPFPTRRSQQISQQTAYNKEVSILSGVAKYVGFPAAPELSQTQPKEVEDDMQKMGLSLAQIRAPRNVTRPVLHNVFNNNLSAPAAEEQFLEQTPWANPQHPIHRLGLNRQESTRSPVHGSFSTPAHQQHKQVDNLQPIGSSSTILENPSAQASSINNTPYDGIGGSLTKNEFSNSTGNMNGLTGYRNHDSASPLETRRANISSLLTNNSDTNGRVDLDGAGGGGSATSPSHARASAPASPKHRAGHIGNAGGSIGLAKAEDIPRNKTSSPFQKGNKRGGNGLAPGKLGTR